MKFSGVNLWRDLHHFAKNLQSDPSVQHHVYCWVKVDLNLCEVQSVCNPCLIMDLIPIKTKLFMYMRSKDGGYSYQNTESRHLKTMPFCRCLIYITTKYMYK